MDKNTWYDHRNSTVNSLAKAIVSSVQQQPNQKTPLLCIGTDKSTGDSYGPLVGALLKQKKVTNFSVYGTLENPVHALNVTEYIEELQEKYKFIIAIDAALGNSENIGKIKVDLGSLKPGSVVGHDLPSVGNLSIRGVVGIPGVDYKMSKTFLNTVRLNLVIKLANITTQAFIKADHYLSLTKDQHKKSNVYAFQR